MLLTRLKEINAKNFVDEEGVNMSGPYFIEDESPNNLDPDEDVIEKETIDNEKIEKEVKEVLTTFDEYAETLSPLEVDLTTEEEHSFTENYTESNYEFSEPTTTEQVALKKPTTEEMQESMILCEDPYSKEDTSGNTESKVDKFLEKYADGNDIIQILRKDIMSILSDMQWIKESNNQHEQWAMDFADAINEISVSI